MAVISFLGRYLLGFCESLYKVTVARGLPVGYNKTVLCRDDFKLISQIPAIEKEQNL